MTKQSTWFNTFSDINVNNTKQAFKSNVLIQNGLNVAYFDTLRMMDKVRKYCEKWENNYIIKRLTTKLSLKRRSYQKLCRVRNKNQIVNLKLFLILDT